MQSVTHKHRRIPVGMRPGQRQLASASVLISLTDAVPVAMRAKVREVSHVFVPAEDRRKRLATALMNLVCQEADANGITLILTVDPYDTGGPTAQQLQDWYALFGFRELQDSPNGKIMARQVSNPRSNCIARLVHSAVH
jgi:N-acetylglutamate synthase-like GNAT family acetyltransferase